ncbi:argininosuccinate lyase [Halocatena halophila]|uniref:argininosuccinate lyase n=1 Tax=Halocatena halophila TaxID=2814576 RepID=UPI002ED12262
MTDPTGAESTAHTDGTAVRGDRFSGGPARGFLSSLGADARIFEADIAVDRAHVVMLAETEIIDATAAGTILQALDTIAIEGHDALEGGEDVHEAIESAVIEQVGPEGGKMHTARSRNDEVATCIRYRLREDLLEAIDAAIGLREAFAAVATDHRETVMCGFTHLQPAQPTTLAHWAVSYERALTRDTERLFEAFDRTNQSPLGSCAFGGTPFPIDRERTATLLGFDGLVENAMDGASSRDFLLEATTALAGLATTLSGIAEDLVIYANRGFVELDDDYASTSSIMPQKKNPDSIELVRSTAGIAHAGVTGLLNTLKGLPRAYNIDLQNATPHAWDTVDAVTEATTVTAGAIATATFQVETLEAAAGEGFTTATGVADQLAMGGLPFRTAHEIVAQAAQHGSDLEAIRDAADEILEEPLETYCSENTIEKRLDPSQSVADRSSRGGPAPAAIDSQLELLTTELTEHENELEARNQSLVSAHEQLAEVTHQYV